MDKQQFSASNNNPVESGAEATHLRGRWLVLARTTWVAFVLLALLIYFTSLPLYDAQLQALCIARACVPGQLTPERALFLRGFGIPISFYAAMVIALNIATAMVWFAVGIVIFWRRHNDWMALLVALALVLVGTTVPPSQSAPFWQWPIQFVDFLAVVSLFIIFCIFPSGTFVPRWMRWLPLVYAALNVFDLFPNVLANIPYWATLLYFAVLFGCTGMLGVAQIYRYRRVSNVIERQQIKWIVYSCATTITGEFVFWLLTLVFPSLGRVNSLYDLFFSPISIVLILLIPLSVGTAILRYRLWDVDLIINRTLVYGTLTTVLALVYFGCVVLLQQLLRTMTGQGSPLAIVGSTLVIAVLFQPLRHSIQAAIDLRFYRRRYNAGQALSAFAAQIRHSQEVDLATLTGDVMEIVKETMQPERVSIWLCEPSAPSSDEFSIRASGRLRERQENVETKTSSGTLLQTGKLPALDMLEHSREQRPLKSKHNQPLFKLAWVALAIVTFGLFVVALPLRSTHLHILCADMLCGGSQPIGEVAQLLSRVGLSTHVYSIYAMTLQIVFALVCFLVATIIFWRRSDDRMALLVALFLMAFVVSFTDVPHVLWQTYPAWRWPIATVALIGEISLPLCFYLFPNGQFVPRWTRWFLPGWLLWGILTYFFPALPIRSNPWFILLEGLCFASGIGSIVIAQLYRYRRVSTPLERQQTKWVVFGLTTGLLGFLIAGFLGFLLPQMLFPAFGFSSTLATVLLGIMAITLTYLAMLLIPLSVGMAMLRFRLWEIDVLVNRTMIYGLMIAIIGLTFIISFFAEQRLVQTLPGEASELLLVVSTLALVMLFQPLRLRVQKFITRHFYRRKYLAEQTLDDFSVTLRNEVHLDQLREHLLTVVDETMQPTYASLWLKNREPDEPHDDAHRYTRVLRM